MQEKSKLSRNKSSTYKYSICIVAHHIDVIEMEILYHLKSLHKRLDEGALRRISVLPVKNPYLFIKCLQHYGK